MTPWPRLAAALIGLTALAALIVQGGVAAALPDAMSLAGVIWRMAAYFTILTNAIAAAFFAAFAFGLRPTARVAAAVPLCLLLLLVGLVYHAVLADIWSPTGIAWWADQGLHTATPVAAALWWLRLAPRAGLSWRDLPAWLAWPAACCLHAVLRGSLTGFWPYPFLDVQTLGATQVALNVAGLVALFALLGAGLIALGRLNR